MKLLALLFVTVTCAFGTPIGDVEEVNPTFDAYSQVRILLTTRENLNNPVRLNFRDLNSIRQSPFNPSKPTRVLVHGWFEDEESDIKVETSRELLALYDFNILFIDWSEGSRTITYVQARNRVRPVGQFLGSYLDFLSENGLIDYTQLTVVGFSLGAHMAGIAGKSVRNGRINNLFGLDPAGSLFDVNTPAERLASTDARYVEVIHTNGGIWGYGIGQPIGHSDFFPNGGSVQSGCITTSCSHLRAVDFYIESIGNNRFFSQRCATANEAAFGRCTGTPGAWFGGEPSNVGRGVWGIFHFTTNTRSPFGNGQQRNF